MSVYKCGRGCSRQIFESSITGGGAPVAMANANAYASAALQCHGCGQYFCEACSKRDPSLSPMSSCPTCGGDLAFPGVAPPAGFPLAGVALGLATPAASAVQRSRRPSPSRPSNKAATFSFMLGCLGALCCFGTFMPSEVGIAFAGCAAFLVDVSAILTGAIGVLKARATGVGMGLSITGIALGLINLLVTALVFAGVMYTQM